MKKDEYLDSQIKDKVKDAIDRLYEKDVDLINRDANERTITHRLAIYLEEMFDEWEFHIDCEYNRNGIEPKYIILNEEERSILNEGLNCQDIEAKTAYPDIIIHKRGCNDQNLLIIEVKKRAGHLNRGWYANEQIDQKKLQSFTSNEQDYNFRLGVFIRLQENDPIVKWFHAGQEEQV